MNAERGASASPPFEGEAGGAALKGEGAAEPGGFFAKLAAALPTGMENLDLGDCAEEAGAADKGVREASAGRGWAVKGAARAGKVAESGEVGGGVARGGKGYVAASDGGMYAGMGRRDKKVKAGGEKELTLSEQTLLFDSRFEGGNLAKAIQVHELEYDLYLMPDINTKAAASGGNTQWYYFAVTNMEAGVEYKINIVNLVKPDSLYNAGMRPALYSITDAGAGIGWRRVGERIAYYENHYETENGQSYYTLTFSLTFPHSNDVCYLAHCFPYSYADMSAVLAEVMSKPNASRIIKMSTLCTTLVGNKCPMLTVTNFGSSPDAIARRRCGKRAR